MPDMWLTEIPLVEIMSPSLLILILVFSQQIFIACLLCARDIAKIKLSSSSHIGYILGGGDR